MAKIDGIESPARWVAENEPPPSSTRGIGEVLHWVADLDEQAVQTPSSEEKLKIERKRDLIFYVLKCAYASPEFGRSDEVDYFKVSLQTIKDERPRDEEQGAEL